MNIPMHTSNVTKYSNFLISISFKFRTIFLKWLHSNIDEEIESSLLTNNHVHSHNTRTNNQMSILRLNRSKTKHCVLLNGMITWNSLPDIFKVKVSFSMFKSKVRNFTKYWCRTPLWFPFFLTCLQLRFFKCNCFWFWVLYCQIYNYLFCGYNQDNQDVIVSWMCSWQVKLL